jgi:predicted DCC family thiol-disulfide oxidoreductase YuxK
MSATLSCDGSEVSDRPDVVYDGECSFCARQIEKFKTRDTDRVFEYVPRQTEVLERRLKVWKWFAWLYQIPELNSLCRAVYAWIARNRYRLAKRCDDGSCTL